MATIDLHRVAVDGADAGSQLLQDLQAKGHVGDLGDVLNAADAVHQQGGGDDGHGGVFGAADLYFTKQGFSTLYNILCQNDLPSLQKALFCGGKTSQKQFARPVRLHTGENTRTENNFPRGNLHSFNIPYWAVKCKPFLKLFP